MKYSIVYTFYFLANYFTTGLEVIPERTKVIELNPKYISDVILTVRKQGRGGLYVFNIDATLKHTWANNVSVHLIFYEYLHNEFKRSFVEMKFKACDMVNKEPIFIAVCQKAGLRCPILAGRHSYHNLSLVSVPAIDNMPYKWPFQKAKVEAIFTSLVTMEKMAEVYLILSFKQSHVAKKGSKQLTDSKY